VNYALLIYRSTPASEPLPEHDEEAALNAHRALQAETAASAQLHAVARLDDPSTARTVRPRAGAHETTDGPYMEAKEWLVGFYVLECESEAQALERARRICPDGSHLVEVRPVTWRRGP
jgi:hypothetical protein